MDKITKMNLEQHRNMILVRKMIYIKSIPQQQMKKMTQSEIDELANESELDSSVPSSFVKEQKPSLLKPAKQQHQQQSYGDQFESYQESKNTFSKSKSKTDLEEIKKAAKIKASLQEIKEEKTVNPPSKEKNLKQKSKEKIGIYFNQPKNPPRPPSAKQHLPYNYVNLQPREQELLLTTVTEQNKNLKLSLSEKVDEFKNLQLKYNLLRQERVKADPSIRQAMLQKQLNLLKSKHQKLQGLLKAKQEREGYKTMGKTVSGFVPEEEAAYRQTQLLQVIDKLKDRLLASDKQLKTLLQKLNDGEDYVQEVKRKMKRVEQLEFRIDKMTEQAENDRLLIEELKDKNKSLDKRVHQLNKEKQNLEVQIKRMEMGQATQGDLVRELAESKREKELLQKSLKELTASLMGNVKSNFQKIKDSNIQDSNQIFKVR